MMSFLFKNNLHRARKFFIGATVFFSSWTVLNVAAAAELNPLWGFNWLATLAVFGKACGSGFSWWLVEKRLKKQTPARVQV